MGSYCQWLMTSSAPQQAVAVRHRARHCLTVTREIENFVEFEEMPEQVVGLKDIQPHPYESEPTAGSHKSSEDSSDHEGTKMDTMTNSLTRLAMMNCENRFSTNSGHSNVDFGIFVVPSQVKFIYKERLKTVVVIKVLNNKKIK